MSKSKPCDVCGQRRPFIPTDKVHNGGPVCPKCGHHEKAGNGVLWEKLFYSLSAEVQAKLLGVPVNQLPTIPAKYRKPTFIDGHGK